MGVFDGLPQGYRAKAIDEQVEDFMKATKIGAGDLVRLKGTDTQGLVTNLVESDHGYVWADMGGDSIQMYKKSHLEQLCPTCERPLSRR